MASDILIVDDEADIRDLVAGILDDEGFSTRTARDSDTALAEIANRRPHLVFLDIWLQGSKLDGLQLLEQIKKDNPDLPVVMISGHGNIETAVAAIKRGAYDFIEKPFKSDRLILVATRALETSRLKREVKELKQLAPTASILTGRSPCMNQLRQTIERAAKANSRILIVGPSGAGKELAARTLHHALEPRRRAVRRHQRRRDHAGADGGRAVRRRAVQWRAAAQGRRAGRGAWRHAVHRRDRRHAARDPEQDPARAGRPDLPARRRHRQGAGRRPHHLLDRAQPRRGDRRGPVPRGPLSSPVGGADPRAAAVGAARGHPRTDRLFHGPDFGRRPACRSARSGRTRWRCCSRMSGRAMSASSATMSSA